ncbi:MULTISPECIES: hypothetical protein [Pontibacillus]|uniref:Uncharacterized protein n=1 Tax=Pontibacillus chungwhensis TaxID=265426 RepID=A0ABY8UUD4_9BACI|nr:MULTISPECIES: hypothetical protein [Pontibacillus]MCD5323428.1 hypothetical protein [Pontibacillus sp. HN14]WIF96808.1 hypothetical protein QNI29_13730 [Pontibacillus chungwhensis]
MDFLSWYDWITPTTPKASFFICTILTFLIGVFVWFETKKKSKVAASMGGSLIASCIIIYLLLRLGYYSS